VANQEKKDEYPFSFMVLILLAAVIVSSIAKQHTNSNAAQGTGACIIALMVAAKSRWELRGKWWFWVALCVGAALQLPLIFLMPWAAPHLTGSGAMAFCHPGISDGRWVRVPRRKGLCKQHSPQLARWLG
jgi:hypothetical protein